MLATYELRWFEQGVIPTAFKDWFNEDCLGEQLGSGGERQDWYLRSAAPCEYLNVKLREGRLEVKWRRAQLGVWRFGPAWSGKIEHWVKWLCEDASIDNFLPTQQGEAAWIGVKKARSQRRLQLREPANQDCLLELTQLQIAGNDWWSLGFETVGEDTRIPMSLQALSSQVSEGFPGTLAPEQSFGYPHLLGFVL